MAEELVEYLDIYGKKFLIFDKITREKFNFMLSNLPFGTL